MEDTYIAKLSFLPGHRVKRVEDSSQWSSVETDLIALRDGWQYVKRAKYSFHVNLHVHTGIPGTLKVIENKESGVSDAMRIISSSESKSFPCRS